MRALAIRIPRPVLAGGVVMLALHLYPALALAQKPGRLPGQDNGRLQWGVFAGILVLTCIAGFINPKRSHLG